MSLRVFSNKALLCPLCFHLRFDSEALPRCERSSASPTCSVPSERQPLGAGLGGQPQGEEAEQEAGQVNEEVSSICDDSETPGNVAT